MDWFPINKENFEAWNMNVGEKLHSIFYLNNWRWNKKIIKKKWKDYDNEISIRERIRKFNYETKTLIEYLRNKGKITVFEN